MESNLILSKESSSEEIKSYFHAVLRLSQDDNEFPINLDDVWPLVYSRKDKAVRSLEENFIQDVDYQVLPQNGENLQGGRPTNVYHITLSCMEFFIARKVRPVFEVYRQVFHGVAKGQLAKSVKTEAADGYTLEDKVEYICLCKECGFYAWEVAGLVGDLLDGIRSMADIRKVVTLLNEKQVLEARVLQIVMSIYARQHGLPSMKTYSEIKEQETKLPRINTSARSCARNHKDRAVRSMKSLLRDKGYHGIYAYEVMQSLCNEGYVRKVEFQGSNRWEWTLTEEGELFGRNTACRGGVAIRPKWLSGKFDLMMRKIGYERAERKEVQR